MRLEKLRDAGQKADNRRQRTGIGWPLAFQEFKDRLGDTLAYAFLSSTEFYAERDIRKAVEIMRAIG